MHLFFIEPQKFGGLAGQVGDIFGVSQQLGSSDFHQIGEDFDGGDKVFMKAALKTAHCFIQAFLISELEGQENGLFDHHKSFGFIPGLAQVFVDLAIVDGCLCTFQVCIAGQHDAGHLGIQEFDLL